MAPRPRATSAPRPPAPERRRRRQLSPWTPAAITAVGIALAALPAWIRPAARPVEPVTAQGLPVGYELLLGSLDRRRRCWLPAERERLVPVFAELAADLAPPLLWVLDRPDHARFAEAASFAAELGIQEAVPALQTVVKQGAELPRAAALPALDRLRPLPAEDLQEHCLAAAASMRRAALVALAARADHARPEALVVTAVRMLADADDEVRQQAMAALPDTLPEAAAPEVVRLLDDEATQCAALAVLPRLPPRPATVAALLERAPRLPDEMLLALLQQFGAWAAEPALRTWLWQLVRSGGDTAVRVAALHCLEQGGADSGQLPRDVWAWPEALRCAAARLLLRDGDRRGVELLLELCEAGDTATGIRAQALHLLARVSGLPPHAQTDEFRLWSSTLRELPPVSLPLPQAP